MAGPGLVLRGGAGAPRELSPQRAVGCMVAFFAVFLLFGLAAFVPFFALPAWRQLATGNWSATPCEVLQSQVETVSGDDGPTYRVAVRYEYAAGGSRRTSERYDFVSGSSSGLAGKQAIVDRYPAGRRTTCWVDPADPNEAVLSRAWRLEWLFGLIPLVFALIGAGGIAFALRTGRGVAGLPAGGALEPWAGAALRAAAADRAAAFGPVTLRPRHTRLGVLFGALFVALFWNGIVSLFVWQLVSAWREGRSFEGCLALFLVPFVLIGLLLLATIPYQLLALLNPRPTLTLTRSALAPGDSAHLTWHFAGLPGRIRRLRILLEGREVKVDVSDGSSRPTMRTLASVTVIETHEGSEIASGSRMVAVPADARPSDGESGAGGATWCLKVQGEIAYWPDVNEEFPITVLPGGGSWGE
jgi:hypothetical protein